ncbi:MAG: Na+:solute symporter, partial [Candidatus Hydrogenedentes bacterium]|nr:Na+:solute symporter [Candidatus Hydrogenedentota bacterium]
ALIALLDDPEADIRQCAAYAILRIERRAAHPLHILDWAAIVGYAGLMIGVGWYYSRRTKTAEDYHLGGRSMRPLLVGFSMFATLLSTLTYLALPGEMMKHGPMIISQYTIYPLTFLVIAFGLIPVIMKQNVTSAYEILENKLGLSVRMLGSIFFLSLRFLWMALIIYATCSKVLIPLLQLDESMTPVLCAVMGVITVIYTSMGGLRAVVVTDAIQTAILFGGAFLTLTLITWHMGGVSAWWPDQWSADWDPVKIMYNSNARITVMGAMTSSFVWYICTAGSDQVAIQRYLATRDTPAARRVLFTSICTDVTVGIFLGILGLALFAFFRENPHMLPDNFQSLKNADTLFPRFIAMALPAGFSGLVIAGLLAAAMSSLSSGVNSSSLVITVDFLNRFAKKDRGERERVNQAKWVAVFVGAAVILLSIFTGMVSGNLLEVVYKVVNLLVAPLFVLFFMALFVPWANAPGTIIAGFCSLAVAIGIAYGNWFGLSFIWIMPLALITGIITGPLLSLLFLKRRTTAS